MSYQLPDDTYTRGRVAPLYSTAEAEAAIATWRKVHPALPVAPKRIESDPYPKSAEPPHFRPTMHLRWHQTKTGRSHVLQQLWVSDDATVKDWRTVPTVKPP